MTNVTGNKTTNSRSVHLYTPAQIKEYLDKYIIGQDEAKKTLAVAVYNVC